MTHCKTTGKIRYPSEEAAQDTLSSIWAQPHPGRRLECRAYLCPDCDGYHLTSKPDRRTA